MVLNVVGSGSGRPLADPRTGFAFGATIQDATTSLDWLYHRTVLVVAVGGLIFVEREIRARSSRLRERSPPVRQVRILPIEVC